MPESFHGRTFYGNRRGDHGLTSEKEGNWDAVTRSTTRTHLRVRTPLRPVKKYFSLRERIGGVGEKVFQEFFLFYFILLQYKDVLNLIKYLNWKQVHGFQCINRGLKSLSWILGHLFQNPLTNKKIQCKIHKRIKFFFESFRTSLTRLQPDMKFRGKRGS